MSNTKTITGDVTQPDCPPGHIRSDKDLSCVPEVRFHREPNISLTDAQTLCRANGWVMATAPELQAAWDKLGYNNFGYGMIDNGVGRYKIALPIQQDLTSSLKRGANIGVGTAIDGFYYVRAEAVTREQNIVIFAEATIVGDTPQECLPGQIRNAEGACIPEVQFFRWFDPAGFNLETAQIICSENGWALATAEEIEAAWKNTTKPLDHLVYGMIAAGRFAVPVQKDYEVFQRGPNLGAEGGNEGFFYVLATAVSRTQDAPAQPRKMLQYYESGNRYAIPLQYVADGSGSSSVGRYHTEMVSGPLQSLDETNNWMIEMWSRERPLTLSRDSVLVAAAKAYLQKKQFPLTDGVLQQVAASVKADPVARYKFAPFLLKVCFAALVAENPTPAQQIYRVVFERYQSQVDHERAVATLQAWEQYQGRSNLIPPKYQPITLSVINFQHAPSVAGFMESDPLEYGQKGGAAVALLYLPMAAHAGILENLKPGGDIAKLGEELIEVAVGAGLGSAVGAAALLFGSAAAFHTVVAAHFTTVVLGAAQATLATAEASLALATTQGGLHAKLVATQAFVNANSMVTSLSGSSLNVASTTSSLVGPALIAVTAAVILGMTVAEVAKKDAYERKLRAAANGAHHFQVVDFLNVPANERESRRMALFTLMTKHLIAQPVESRRLSLALPEIPEPTIQTALDTLAEVVRFKDSKEVKFHNQNSLTLAQAQELAQEKGWFLATEAEVLKAWTDHQLNVFAYGMMANGSFAVPVQSDQANFKKGPNIGVTGGNQGFFYTEATPSAASQAALDAMRAKEEAAAQATAAAQQLAVNRMAVATARAEEYALIQIEDNLHHKELVAGDNSDGYIRHREALNQPNASWQFIPTGDGYYYIIDGKDYKALVAGDTADNRVYHQAPRDRDNAKWKLEPLGNGTFHITDKKHGRSLVAGTTYDGNVYHQHPQGRKNAAWRLKVVGSENGKIPDEINYAHLQIEDGLHGKVLLSEDTYSGNIRHQDANEGDNAKWQFIPAGDGFYYIIDVKHQKALVAGDTANNRIYHQAAYERENAQWKLEPLGNGTFHITDKKHGKSLVAGTTYDGNVYHQPPQGRENAAWKLKVVGSNLGVVPKEME